MVCSIMPYPINWGNPKPFNFLKSKEACDKSHNEDVNPLLLGIIRGRVHVKKPHTLYSFGLVSLVIQRSAVPPTERS